MKTTKILTIVVVALSLIMCQTELSVAEPMGTAFTYQGHLYDANYAADGLYDFSFKLYDANVGGSKVGTDVNVAEVDVIDGYFTVELDFGSGVFSGDARWLEIGVRPGAQSDPNSYTTLSPRQEVTPTPYAIYAETSGGDGDWMVSGNDMYSIPSGNVGIGTTSPVEHLHLYGSNPRIRLQDTDEGIAASPIVGFFDSDSRQGYVGFGSIGSSDLYIRNEEVGDIVLMPDSGNVGIGTMSPAAKLTVDGGILREGSTMYGSASNTHINLGVSSTTGTSGQNYDHCTVGGGIRNTAEHMNATVGGGRDNEATGFESTISGGGNNTANLDYATVGGGHENTADNYSATVGGGSFNIAGGRWSTVPGGYVNEAQGDFSFAAGRRAKANHDGAFVWADSTPSVDFVSTGNDQFLIRASGGVGIGTTNPGAELEVGGQVKITGGSPGAGKVLTSDASGLATWQIPAPPGDSDWIISGNNIYSAVSGNVGINTTSPAYRLDIEAAGTTPLRITGGGTAWPKLKFDIETGGHSVLSIFDSGANEDFRLATTGNSWLKGYGNVGIGREPTTNKLEVQGNASKSTAGDWLANSDARIKTDVQTITSALETLDKVRLVSFKYSDDYRDEHSSIEDRRYLNVIAQEFQEVFPDYVKSSGEKLSNGEEILQVDAYPLTVYSAAAVQELHTIVKERDTEITKLKERIAKMETLMAKFIDEQEGYQR